MGNKPKETPFHSSKLKKQFSGIIEQNIYESVNRYVKHQAGEIVFNNAQIFDAIDQLWGNNA